MKKLVVFFVVVSFVSLFSCKGRDRPGDYSLKWISGLDPDSESPISLTASDGTGLEMVSLKVEGVVEEPLAFTELHMIFKNPEDRQREGRFEITLPPGAAISRFSMKIDGHWQEAEVVERQAARVAYEDFLHRRQDPALLEKKAGNQFRARVFPIPANSKKELILSYSQELVSDSYVIPLQGLPKLDSLNVEVKRVQLSGGFDDTSSHSVKEKNITPKQDLALVRNKGGQAPAVDFTGLRNGDLSLARVAPKIKIESEPLDRVTILLDTSASRALGFDRQIDRVFELVSALEKKNGKEFWLRVVCFDQEVMPVFEGPSSDLGKGVRDEIVTRHALGASDLEGALSWVIKNPNGSSRLLLFTDGIVTAGEQETDKLKKSAFTLAVAGIRRIDAIVDGGIRNETLLGVLTKAQPSRFGVVADAGTTPEILAKKLLHSTASGIKVSVPGAKWVWPTALNGVQPGDQFIIYAELPEGEPMSVVLEGASRDEFKISTRKAQRPLLERASANAQIQSATHRISELDDQEAREQFKKQIVELSIKHRVLSDYTALLVLETEQDYRRFNIDRNSLSDIMVVGKRGIELVKRGGKKLIAQDEVPQWLKREKRDEKQGGKGKRHKGEEGQMGKRDARKTDNHYGIKGPRDNPDPHMARSLTKEQAKNSGILSLLSEQNAPSAPLGQESASASDPESALGALRGGQVGDNFGYGGLGLKGTGRGGGGTGEGTIGLGSLNTIGHGGGGGSGSGYGRGAGGMGGRRGSAPVRTGAAMVRGSLSKEVIRRIVRRHLNEVKFCYERQLVNHPDLSGRVTVKFIISGNGSVQMAALANSTIGNPQVENCIVQATRRWTFPQPEGGGIVIVDYPFMLTPSGGSGGGQPLARPSQLPPLFNSNPEADAQNEGLARGAMHSENPYNDRLKRVMDLLEEGKHDEALKGAWLWRVDEPGDVLAIIGLGEAAEAGGKKDLAARVYGSIIDLFPSRADLRRMAGQRLERLGSMAQDLIVDTYQRAVEQRPDHPSSHRLYGYALLEAGKHEEAFEALRKGLEREYPGGRYAAVKRILREDLGLVAAAWLKANKDDEKKIVEACSRASISISDTASTRFVLHWETDANDVDLHVYDGRGDHAYYSKRRLMSGGELYADVTTGYGPECFTIFGSPRGFPYAFQTHYYSRGPMGYGMGKIQIIEHDGKGGLWFSHRPFVIMNDSAYVGLGMYNKPLSVSDGSEDDENQALVKKKAASKLADLPIAN